MANELYCDPLITDEEYELLTKHLNESHNSEYVVIADVYSEKECCGLYTFNSPIFNNLDDAENFFENWDIPVDEMLQTIKEHLKVNKDETNIQISIGIRRND